MEFGMVSKPSTSGNSISNAILEQIHQVLGNLVQNVIISRTYVDKDDPCLVILYVAEFAIFLTANKLNCYSPGHLVFGHNIIIPIKH